MYDLAKNYGNPPVILREIAKRQDISEKYLSKLIIPLKGARLVYSSRGAHGGYTLARDPSKITIREIVEILEGDIAPVECVKDITLCSRGQDCPTRDIWCRLEDSIKGLLNSISLADILANDSTGKDGSGYCI